MSDQSKTAISTKEAPAAIGPYSQAVRVGDMLFASGQVALDPATGQLVAGGITEQTVRVLENVKAVLAKAGLDMCPCGEDDRVFEVDERLCGDERGVCDLSGARGCGSAGAVDGGGRWVA